MMKRKLLFLREHWFAVVVTLSVVFLAVGSEHSMYQIGKLWSEQSDVKRRIQDYKEQTKEYRIRLGEVDVNDASKLEEYARLRLGMKKHNEDVFIFED